MSVQNGKHQAITSKWFIPFLKLKILQFDFHSFLLE